MLIHDVRLTLDPDGISQPFAFHWLSARVTMKQLIVRSEPPGQKPNKRGAKPARESAEIVRPTCETTHHERHSSGPATLPQARRPAGCLLCGVLRCSAPPLERDWDHNTRRVDDCRLRC